MGSGNLSREVCDLAQLLADAGISPQRAMLLHLQVLGELLEGLGNRSGRHVMTRADLLLLELLAHLAENYRRLFRAEIQPPRQLHLPGF